MREVTLADGRRTTGTVFGCGGLGGSTGFRQSRELVLAAWEAGIRHFDVAPSYGFGEAERFLGRILPELGESAVVTTKVGIAAALRPGAAKRAVMAAARGVLGLSPQLRSRLGQKMRAGQARGQFAPAFVRASVETSLRALARERIDILLLHEATAEDLSGELLSELAALQREGKVGMLGIGSRREEIARLPQTLPEAFNVLQTSWVPSDALAGKPAHRRANFHGALQHVTPLGQLIRSEAPESRELVRTIELATERPLRSTGDIAKLLLALADADAAATGGQLVAQSSRRERIAELAEFQPLPETSAVNSLVKAVCDGAAL